MVDIALVNNRAWLCGISMHLAHGFTPYLNNEQIVTALSTFEDLLSDEYGRLMRQKARFAQ